MQVTKGPIGTKGPRVTTNLVSPGAISSSAQLRSQRHLAQDRDPKERQRLSKILRELAIPDGMGVIMRTVGEGQQTRYFVRDLAFLLEEWTQVERAIAEDKRAARASSRSRILIERTVRDFLTEEVDEVICDDQRGHRPDARDDRPDLTARPEPHSASTTGRRRSSTVQRAKAARRRLSRQVQLKSGGYIVIDETEALVAIDVNTGRNKGGKDSRRPSSNEPGSRRRNRRQLRLRNMGGLIVLDFIDMKSRKDQQEVYSG